MRTETARPAVAPAALPVPRFTPAELSALLGETNSPTAEQSQIISSPLSPRLVIAGAGSGKTLVLTHRISHLTREHGVRPFEVLPITFTNATAYIMPHRVSSPVRPVAENMAVSTFHAPFAHVLPRHAAPLPSP